VKRTNFFPAPLHTCSSVQNLSHSTILQVLKRLKAFLQNYQYPLRSRSLQQPLMAWLESMTQWLDG